MESNTLGSLFKSCQLKADTYDEMFSAPAAARPFAKTFFEEFSNIPVGVFKNLQSNTSRFFLNHGITFNIYDKEEKSERLFPIDCIPRLMSYEDWSLIKKGLEQRIKAINLFLWDIYHKELILKDNIVPKDLIYSCKNYRLQMKNVSVPENVYVSLCGTDLVRTKKGFFVLEDNLRVPSGTSYMLTCRQAMIKNFLSIFRKCHIQPIESYCLELLKTLFYLSPKKEEAQVVLLTPGPYNSAYFEHVFLAGQMGVELVQGQDLQIHDNNVYMKTTKGLKKVDVIYSRINDDFLDPLNFRSDSCLGVPGLFSAYQSGSVALSNAPGTGVADDKAVYSYMPQIIRYYLEQEPILSNVPTYLCRKPKELEHTLNNLKKMVVKTVGGAGGYGMFIGPTASKKETEEFSLKLKSDPENYVSQPVLSLSTSPCFIGDAIEPRHVDLRPFVLYSNEMRLVPGGLCRVALKKDSLVVNSSQGGGAKDIWIIDQKKERSDDFKSG